jgi:hypothetical protein
LRVADITPPALLSFTTVTQSPSNASHALFALSFSEPVSGLAAASFVASHGAPAVGLALVTPASGRAASFAVSLPVSLTAQVELRFVSAGALIRDAAGNALTAVNASASVTIGAPCFAVHFHSMIC